MMRETDCVLMRDVLYSLSEEVRDEIPMFGKVSDRCRKEVMISEGDYLIELYERI